MRRLARLLVVAALAAGALVSVGGVDVASGQTGPVGYTVGVVSLPTGGQFDCEFFAVDVVTGEATRISEPSTEVACADGLTFGPDGTLYAYTNPPLGGFPASTLVTIDLATGAQTPVGDLPPVLIGSGGMTFDGAGNLWLYGATPGGTTDPDCASVGATACLWQVNPADGSSTFIGAASPERQVFGLAATCSDVLAITTPILQGQGGSGTEVARVDTATAALDLVVETDDIFFPSGLDFDAGGALWAIARQLTSGDFSPLEVDNIDLSTGASTHTPITFGGDPFIGFLAGLAISPISCPEPPAPAPEVVLQPTFTG